MSIIHRSGFCPPHDFRTRKGNIRRQELKLKFYISPTHQFWGQNPTWSDFFTHCLVGKTIDDLRREFSVTGVFETITLTVTCWWPLLPTGPLFASGSSRGEAQQRVQSATGCSSPTVGQLYLPSWGAVARHRPYCRQVEIWCGWWSVTPLKTKLPQRTLFLNFDWSVLYAYGPRPSYI